MDQFKLKEEHVIESNLEKKQGIFSTIEALEKKFKLPLALVSFLTILSATDALAGSETKKEKWELTPQRITEAFEIPSDSVYSIEISDRQSKTKGNISSLEGKTISGSDIYYMHIFDRKTEFKELFAVSPMENKDLKLDKIISVEGMGNTPEEAVASAISESINMNELHFSEESFDISGGSSSFESASLEISTKKIFKFKIDGYNTYENPHDHGKSITAKVTISFYSNPNKIAEKNL